MRFTATEFGFEKGVGGASNAACRADYHYVLFGLQADEQHPENEGVYFEFDDESHGAVDCVTAVGISSDYVEFELRDGQKVIVERGIAQSQWSEFLRGVNDIFGDEVIRKRH